MTEKISVHIQEDRIDRATYIATTVGFGEVIKEVPGVDEKGRLHWKRLTDTGVIFILNSNKSIIVTLWIASPGQIHCFYPHEHTPNWIYKIAIKNKKYMKKQDKG